VPNQPDVARGITSREVVEEINQYLAGHLAIDEIFTCCHDTVDNCACRKPQPGALLAAARKYAIDLKASYMIGDRATDIEAGHRAGCQTIFIDCGYSEKKPSVVEHKASSLAEAVRIILEGRK